MEETVTSTALPFFVKGERSAVTITAATFLVCNRESETETPKIIDGLIYFRDRYAELTPSEGLMLLPLCQRFRRAVSYESIMNSVYGDLDEGAERDIIKVWKHRLNHGSLREIGLTLKNVWGFGYKLEPIPDGRDASADCDAVSFAEAG